MNTPNMEPVNVSDVILADLVHRFDLYHLLDHRPRDHLVRTGAPAKLGSCFKQWLLTSSGPVASARPHLRH